MLTASNAVAAGRAHAELGRAIHDAETGRLITAEQLRLVRTAREVKDEWVTEYPDGMFKVTQIAPKR